MVGQIVALIRREPAVAFAAVGAVLQIAAAVAGGGMDVQEGVQAVVTVLVGVLIRAKVSPV